MGIFTNFLNARKTFAPTENFYADVEAERARMGDVEDADVDYVAQVFEVAAVEDAAAGDFTLVFAGLYADSSAVDVTTAAIAFDATNEDIQTAVDLAFETDNAAGYTAGDCAVTGDLATGLTIAFSGAAFANVEQDAPVLDATGLEDDMMGAISDPAVTEETEFSPARPAGWAMLRALGILQFEGAPPTDFSEPHLAARGDNWALIKPDFIQRTAREIAEHENDSRVYAGIVRTCGLNP